MFKRDRKSVRGASIAPGRSDTEDGMIFGRSSNERAFIIKSIC